MNQYFYGTDSESGQIDAESLDDAFITLKGRITDEMIADGATLWVSEEDGSNRIDL